MITTELYNMIKELDERDLEQASNIVWTFLNDAREARAREVKRELSPGTRVRVRNIRPKYLNGMIGTVVHFPEGQRVAIKWDYPGQAGRYGYGDSIKVDLTCIEVLTID